MVSFKWPFFDKQNRASKALRSSSEATKMACQKVTKPARMKTFQVNDCAKAQDKVSDKTGSSLESHPGENNNTDGATLVYLVLFKT